MEFFDTHCHLDADAFKDDLPQVLDRARKMGVTRIVTIGASSALESAENAIKLAETHDWIWATAGVHPHDAKSESSMERLLELSRHPRVVAVGETGLDYHYDFSPRDLQEKSFRAQIAIARKVNKPLVIHCRKAAEDCFRILKEDSAADVGGVFHCFGEDDKFAHDLQSLNFIVSFPGIITFKKSEATREIARKIPLDRIMLETDAPYLAPEPFRGKRCESSFMVETAKVLAKVHAVSLEEVAKITTETALKFYKIKRT